MNTFTSRSQERELAAVRAALAERDAQLKSSKDSAREATAALQAKDADLLATYELLLSASKERSQVRQQLLGIHEELAAVSSHSGMCCTYHVPSCTVQG
jgi:hypothetical protein